MLFSIVLIAGLALGPGATSAPGLAQSGSAASSPVPDGGAAVAPTLATLDAWAKFIRPSGEELAFESIGWRNAFWPAVEEARTLGRPILLWTMNGHPLGCT